MNSPITTREEAIRAIVEIAENHDLKAGDIAAALQSSEPPTEKSRAAGVLTRITAYLGGVFVLAGIVLVIGMQWDLFSSAVRVLITLGVGFALYLFALATMTDQRYSSVTTPMLLISALLQPTGIMVMLNEYSSGGDPEHGVLFMCTVMFVQQILTFAATKRSALLFTSLFFGASAFATLCEIFNVDETMTMLAVGSGLTILSYVIDRSVYRTMTPFWYFVGSVLFLIGAFDLVDGTAFEVVYFGIAAGFMYLGTVVKSRTLLVVSVMALMAFIGYFFRDSLANAFGLIIMGVLLIGLSGFAMTLDRKYIRARQQD